MNPKTEKVCSENAQISHITKKKGHFTHKRPASARLPPKQRAEAFHQYWYEPGRNIEMEALTTQTCFTALEAKPSLAKAKMFGAAMPKTSSGSEHLTESKRHYHK